MILGLPGVGEGFPLSFPPIYLLDSSDEFLDWCVLLMGFPVAFHIFSVE